MFAFFLLNLSSKLTKAPNAAVSMAKALLVPYEHRHVLTYHAWMEDPVDHLRHVFDTFTKTRS
jgi:hypothetical protein